ncbi:AraC family transcriptional regulator [Clostridium thermarum]|uniref:AraC family transcriptional regulator n=1 Tax=Clostridium thermarum TaxID=1716543 RepID=UPI00111EBBA8|nr:AraC family transcriptional regulator [Clostridium thermarum]
MILEKQELIFQNVISLRKKMAQHEVMSELEKLNKFIKERGAEKIAPVITTTFGVENSGFLQTIDIEILIPINKEIATDNEYKLKKDFYLTNALKVTHIGNLSMLQNTYNTLNRYIREKGMQPITSVYSITVKDITDSSNADESIIDLYIGVSPNVL